MVVDTVANRIEADSYIHNDVVVAAAELWVACAVVVVVEESILVAVMCQEDALLLEEGHLFPDSFPVPLGRDLGQPTPHSR